MVGGKGRLQLKDSRVWLTLNEAALRMVELSDEPIKVPDVLRFALEAELPLSIRFLTLELAARMAPVDRLAAGGEDEAGPRATSHRFAEQSIEPLKTLRTLDGQPVYALQGVFDLAPSRETTNHLERMYLREIGEPVPEMPDCVGVVWDMRGAAWKLQRRPDDGELEKLPLDLAVDRNGTGSGESEPDGDSFVVSKLGLPAGAQVVVRASRLKQWLRDQAEVSREAAAPGAAEELHPRVRGTLLRLIYVLARGGYGYDPSAKKSDVTSQIKTDAEKFGVEISAQTIRDWLRKAATENSPDATSSNAN